MVEALRRVTPADRAPAALEALGEAATDLTEGRFEGALRHAREAKKLAPRDATVRETLGLAAYRVGDWATSLSELRTYRRLSGDVAHLPVEMDVLRALGRGPDVEEAWSRFQELEPGSAEMKEGLVVFASFLLDEGRVSEAREVVTPRSLKRDPYPEDLRVWYVAARAAAMSGDVQEALRLREAILAEDPSFPGIEELDSAISPTTIGE